MTNTTDQKTAFVTGADHGLGFAFTRQLVERGYHVVAGQFAPSEPALGAFAAKHPGEVTIVPLDVSDDASVAAAARATLEKRPVIDLVINNAAILGNMKLDNSIADGLAYDTIITTISVNALGPLRVVEALLPGLEKSQAPRLCFISSEAGSVTRSYRPNWFGYCMSKTALNMGISILFNDLRPKGYTFRVYHPGWMQTFMRGEEDTKAKYTPEQAARLGLEYFLDMDVDEDRLVMRDDIREEWPW